MTINVRYIVDDVDSAIPFYRDQLGFNVDMNPAPGFAALSRDGVKLYLNKPGAGSAGQADDTGAPPRPGGWNRFQIECDDLDAIVRRLRSSGVTFRTSMAEGQGGRQAVVEDPSGNLIELFEPKKH
jgi:catechol 2,3-dioxygenase-like lactoylglutathione lyase family enzyme